MALTLPELQSMTQSREELFRAARYGIPRSFSGLGASAPSGGLPSLCTLPPEVLASIPYLQGFVSRYCSPAVRAQVLQAAHAGAPKLPPGITPRRRFVKGYVPPGMIAGLGDIPAVMPPPLPGQALPGQVTGPTLPALSDPSQQQFMAPPAAMPLVSLPPLPPPMSPPPPPAQHQSLASRVLALDLADAQAKKIRAAQDASSSGSWLKDFLAPPPPPLPPPPPPTPWWKIGAGLAVAGLVGAWWFERRHHR